MIKLGFDLCNFDFWPLTTSLIGNHSWGLFDANRQVSNIRRAKSQHLKDSCTVLRLSLRNPMKPDVKWRMKM